MNVRIFLFMVFIASPSSPALASVRGVVRDPQNQAVQGAQVEIRGTASAFAQMTTTNASGEFELTTVPSGQYRIRVTSRGFGAMDRTVQVTEASDSVLEFQLRIERVEQTVDVSTALIRVETDVAGKSTASRLDIPTRDLPVQVSSIPMQAL